MTDKNSIVPPRELVQHWFNEAWSDRLPMDLHIAICAAEWGRDQANHDIERKLQEARDQELEACCEWLDREGWSGESRQLRAARRPKPLSLKKQALTQLDEILKNPQSPLRSDTDIIRRALEQLPDD